VTSSRRLAAIRAADVVGYNRLMGEDEAGTAKPCGRASTNFVRFREAPHAPRSIALGRKSWLFAGSERGAERAAVMYTLIQTAKLNDVDPQAWLAYVLARIADQATSKLDELLPWNWYNPKLDAVAA
jgi:IS66 C-terminal element